MDFSGWNRSRGAAQLRMPQNRVGVEVSGTLIAMNCAAWTPSVPGHDTAGSFVATRSIFAVTSVVVVKSVAHLETPR